MSSYCNADNVLTIGDKKIYLCDKHLNELRDVINKNTIPAGKYTADHIVCYLGKYYEDKPQHIAMFTILRILYQAQGLYLSVLGVPLFDDDFTADAVGVTIKEIYDKYYFNSFEVVSDLKLRDQYFLSKIVAMNELLYPWEQTKHCAIGAYDIIFNDGAGEDEIIPKWLIKETYDRLISEDARRAMKEIYDNFDVLQERKRQSKDPMSQIKTTAMPTEEVWR